jgi:hypothetical protein
LCRGPELQKPQLATLVGDSEWAQLIDALKRLHKKRALQLRKWADYRGFVPYTEEEPDGEFFYRADFQLSIAPDGRPYFDELQERGTAGRSKIAVYIDTNIVSRLAKADMTPPVRAALVNILELFNQGKLELVTSDLSQKEIDKLNSVPNIDRDKWNLDVVVSLLKKVPFVQDHKLIGFNSYFMGLVFVDCEAYGGCPATGQLGEFGAVEYPSKKTFYGCVVESSPSAENPAVPSPRAKPTPEQEKKVFSEFASWLANNVEGRPVFVSDNLPSIGNGSMTDSGERLDTIPSGIRSKNFRLLCRACR